MASEIEAVDDGAEVAGGAAAAGEDEESSRNDVYTAAAYGDLEKLQRLVEVEGCSVSEPDGAGYYVLQRAALNNRTATVQYIIEHGGDVNDTDNTGQTALHWSAVRGHIQVSDVLLKEGARIDVSDLYCYQSTHVAAQYGHTAFLYHIFIRWNADPDIPDNDGRSPLHWLSFKLRTGYSGMLTERNSIDPAGIVRDPSAPSFGGWLSHSMMVHPGAIAFLVMDIFLFFGVPVLTFVQASQISRSITTNEMANAMRYSYLRGQGGRFRNPFDHGIRKNCSDFLFKGYNEDVEVKEQALPSEETAITQMTRNLNLQNRELHRAKGHGQDHVCVNVQIKNSESCGRMISNFT